MPALFDGLGDLDFADPALPGPALFDGLGDLEDTPVAVDVAAPIPVPDDVFDEMASPAPRRRTSTTRGSGGEPARKAVFDALALLGSLGAPVPGTTGRTAGSTPLLPTARVRPALDVLAGAGTVEALTAARVDLKALVRDACNWESSSGPKATGAVVKALGAVITGTDSEGRSTYPQAIEMISFASVVAPLLEPDRLVRLIAEAASVKTAYAPLRYTAALYRQLQILLGGFPPQRREQLLISLWHSAHNGRWWDDIGGDAPKHGRRAGRRRKADEELDALREAHEAQLQLVFGGHRAAPPARLVIDALASGALVYSPMATAALQSTVATADELAELGRAARASLDADVAVLVSHVPGIAPDLRPESPIPAMVTALIDSLGDLDEDGAGLAEHLPAKPKTWGELYPKASLKRFPMSAEVRALEGTVLPGTGQPGQPASAVIELIRTPHSLKLNGDEMGNCTFTYRSNCEKGEMVIGRIYQSGHVYNFSIVPDRGAWRLREINSRSNLGNVPAELREGITAIAADLRS